MPWHLLFQYINSLSVQHLAEIALLGKFTDYKMWNIFSEPFCRTAEADFRRVSHDLMSNLKWTKAMPMFVCVCILDATVWLKSWICCSQRSFWQCVEVKLRLDQFCQPTTRLPELAREITLHKSNSTKPARIEHSRGWYVVAIYVTFMNPTHSLTVCSRDRCSVDVPTKKCHATGSALIHKRGLMGNSHGTE